MSTVPAPATAKLNSLALSGFIVSLVGLVLFLTGWLGGVVGLVGLILSIVGRRQVFARGERGAGLALAGIILGAVAVILAIIYTVVLIAVIAPSLTR